MFDMPKSCELRRGRRLITVAGSLTTTAALKEATDPDPAAEEARDCPVPTSDPGFPLAISDHSYVTRVTGSTIALLRFDHLQPRT